MNQRDCRNLEEIIKLANTLMDAGPNPNAYITNADVVEAALEDVAGALAGRPPRNLLALVERDAATRN